jgi:hypothetical protein
MIKFPHLSSEASGSSSTFYASSLQKLPNFLSTFHFFRKEFNYTCHGPLAQQCAKDYYHTENVIRIENGVTTLEINGKLMSKAVQNCLNKRLNVCIWKKEASTGCWEKWKYGTPGNVLELEEILNEDENVNNGSLPWFAALLIAPLSHNYQRLGLALVSTTEARFVVFGCTELKNLAM